MNKASLVQEASKSMIAARATKDKIVTSLTNILDSKLKLLNAEFEQLHRCETCENLKQFKKLREICNRFDDLFRLQDKFVEEIFDDSSPVSSPTCSEIEQRSTNEPKRVTRAQKCSKKEQKIPTKEQLKDEAKPGESIVESLLPKLKIMKEFEAMFVHGGDGPKGFYARIVASASEYQKLEDEINHRCNLSPINFNDVSFPFLAIVRSQEFSKLFRAFVLSGTNEKQCDVFYCDWGNKEIVSAKNIFKAPAEFCQQPAAAIRMTLTNEKNEFTEWTAASAQYFMNLVNKGLSLKVKVREKVLLNEDDISYAVVALIQKDGERFSLYDVLKNHNTTKPKNEHSFTRPTFQSLNVPLEDITPAQCDLENLNAETVEKLNLWFKKSDNNFADPLLPPEDELQERPPSPTGTCLTSVSQRVPTFQFQ